MHEEATIPELTEVVARLSALLGPRTGDVEPLEGGITNRNFRVNFGGNDYVVRLPGRRTELLGIDREAECVATKAAAELGIGPNVAAMLKSPACLVTCFISGREMTPEEVADPAELAGVAQSLRAFHDSGTDLSTTFDSFELVDEYAELARENGVEPPEGFDPARAHAQRIREAIAGHDEHRPVPCHDDLLTANFLHDGERVQIIDWEYAGMGDRYFDLGNLAVNNQLDDDQESALLEAYFGEPSDDRRRATLKLFRFMSDFREAMWGVVQTGISELDFDFRDYAKKHFDRLEATASEPDFEAWLQQARA
jgi:thiamine kinase-like enzyme